MGSDRFYPEERPCRPARIDAFWIDETPVTNREFAAFVAATGYQTFAESAPNPADYTGMDPSLAKAGSLVFEETAGPVNLQDYRQWWQFRFGATWRSPWGEGSTIDGLEDHPVVHVAYQDALAFAHWANKALPTEAEWEYAAKGGLSGMEYAWGDELAPGGQVLANYWQGEFPWKNEKAPGCKRTSPVRSFPPNAFGLYDMIGNVWEWTCDEYFLPRSRVPRDRCCSPDHHVSEPGRLSRKVVKGGSHLCAPSYCRRYRPAARSAQATDTSTSHIGFRCVVREDAKAAVSQS